MGPYRSSPGSDVELIDLRRRAPWWGVLLILPFLLSLATHVYTVTFAGKHCRAIHPEVSFGEGGIVLSFACASMVNTTPLTLSSSSAGGFCGTQALMESMQPKRLIAPDVRTEVDLLVVRLLLAGLAVVGVSLSLAGLGDRGAQVVIDRRQRLVRVQAPPIDSVVAFGDRPVLVARGDMFYLHATQAEPVVVATARTPPERVDELRNALRTLDAV